LLRRDERKRAAGVVRVGNGRERGFLCPNLHLPWLPQLAPAYYNVRCGDERADSQPGNA